MPENGIGNPYWLKKVNPPERGTEHDSITRSNPSLIELQIGCISRESIISYLKRSDLYQSLPQFRECIDSACKTLIQLKIVLGIDYVALTKAPKDNYVPRNISIFYGMNLTNVLNGYIWEANNIIGQYEEHIKRNQIILGVVDGLLAKLVS